MIKLWFRFEDNHTLLALFIESLVGAVAISAAIATVVGGLLIAFD